MLLVYPSVRYAFEPTAGRGLDSGPGQVGTNGNELNSKPCGTPCRAARRRGGFTVVELLFVVMIAGILMSLAVPAFHDYIDRRGVMNARSAFSMAAARARAAAVERGDMVILMVRIYRDSVFVMSADEADTLEVIDYRSTGDSPADILVDGTPAPLRLCYSPRGFIHPSCKDGEFVPRTIGFESRNGTGETAWAVINAAGQVEPQ